jgi:hypothetical protein
LNGYQKGKCFHCFGDIRIVGGDDALADVDHFPRLCWDGSDYSISGMEFGTSF